MTIANIGYILEINKITFIIFFKFINYLILYYYYNKIHLKSYFFLLVVYYFFIFDKNPLVDSDISFDIFIFQIYILLLNS